MELVAIDASAPAPPNVFSELDTNGDKKISKEELTEWFKKQDEERANDADFIKDILKDEDKDDDGHISWDEFSGPKGQKDEL